MSRDSSGTQLEVNWMKEPNNKFKAAINGLTKEQVVRSIAHCQRKAAEIGLTPSAEQRNMLTVYRALYENRKALLESLKEGQPELWTDFLDSPHHQHPPLDSPATSADESRLVAELSHYQEEASRLANQEGTHEQNLHLAYELMAQHRSRQLEALRQTRNSSEEDAPD